MEKACGLCWAPTTTNICGNCARDLEERGVPLPDPDAKLSTEEKIRLISAMNRSNVIARVVDQPPPKKNDNPAVWDIVIEDMKARDVEGRARYNMPLQPFNGRDSLVDAYQEALDKCVYLRQAILERGIRNVPTLPHREAMAAEIDRLQKREQELLEANTRLANEKRAASIRENVIAFHLTSEVLPVWYKPFVPSDDRVRFRARLIAEEFVEGLEALFGERHHFVALKEELRHIIDQCPVNVDIVEATDAWADLDYVVEGTRLEFGVHGVPIMVEVQRSNMSKFIGGVNVSGHKVIKPAGWKKPDIYGKLIEQGWDPRGYKPKKAA